MSSKEFYRQCTLHKKVADKTSCTVSWIPERFAKIGNICELYITASDLQDDWKIVSVGTTKLTGKEVNEKSRSNKDFTHSIH